MKDILHFRLFAALAVAVHVLLCSGCNIHGWPEVDSSPASGISSSGATLEGEVIDEGSTSVTERGVVYSREDDNPLPLHGGAGCEVELAAGGGLGVFSVDVSALEAGTRYVFRAYASNDNAGTPAIDYSDPVVFTTLPGGASGSYPLTFDGRHVKASAVQADGKVIAAGNFTNVEGDPRLNIVRVDSNGAVDPNFSPEVDQPDYGAFINCLAVQADGKIVIGGYFDHIDGQFVGPCIARLNADGTRDTTFSATTGYGSVDCLAIQADGKILVGGILVTLNGAARYQYLGRLNANGTLDTTFNPGTQSVAAGPDGNVKTILVQEDGKILIRGNFSTYNGTTRSQLARINADGSLDASFAPGIDAYAMALQPDGKILVSSYITTEHPQGYGLYRLLSDGTLDNNFTPTPGTSVGVFTDSDIEHIQVQSDGKIVIGGFFTSVDGTAISRVARINADGSLDSGFLANYASYVSGLTLGSEGSLFISTELGATATDVDLLEIFDNTPATNTLSTVFSHTVQWLRGGGGPEVTNVTFDLSTNGGSTWTALGSATRISGGWQRTGLFLPASGLLRARGRTSSGFYGGSTGVVEVIEDFPVPGASKLTLANPTHADVDSDYALLGGEITNTGSLPISERGVVYSRAIDNDIPVIGGVRVTKEVEGGTSSGVFEVDVFDLVGGTTYRYRAYAINSAGVVSYTDVASFTTVGAPTVISPTDTSITATSAILGGNIISDGGNQITGRGVYVIADVDLEEDRLGDNDTGYLEFEDLSYDPIMDPGIGVFTVAVSGLTPDTDYYYAAYAINSEGTVYSEEGFFTTDAVSEPEPSSGGASSDLLSLVEESAPPGQVDTGFNVGSGLGGVDGIVQAIALLPGGTGQLLIAGEFNSVGGEAHRGIARIGASGAVDATFNTNTNGIVNSVAVGSDGSTVIGGIFSQVNGTPRNGIAKLDKNGAIVIPTEFDPGAGADNVIYSVALQEDGKILIGGLFSTVQGQPRNRIARLNANGSLDTGFNPTADNAVYSIVVQPDGRILVAGNFTTIAGTTVNRVARLNANGTIDSGFDPGDGANGRVAALALQPDGKILLGGYFTQVDGANHSRIARLAANGSLDTGFNTGSGANDNILTLALQTDGKILIGGLFTNFNGTGLNRIARLNSNGDLDTAFDAGTGADDEVSALALQPDGNILIGGNFATFDGGAHPFLVRFGNDVATETFTVNGLTSARWLRGGSGPLVPEVVFELSTDSGQTWSDLGDGTAIAGGWEITGLNLPINGRVRALGQTSGGFLGGSSGLAEGSASFDYTAQRNALRAKLAAAKANAAKLSAQIKAAKKKKNAAKAKKLTKSLKTVNSQIGAISADLAKYQ
ncbi:MAG: hypothetical protein JNJ70_14290 [Verrucomicrobiales bacterium]|nr:hypothetical protein [Verrucomicrobiales bacterium]